MSIEKIAKYYVSISVFLFLALSVAFDGSYGITGPIIVSSYFFLFSSKIRARIALTNIEKGLLWMFMVYLGSVLIEILFHQIPFRVMDSEGKLLLFTPLIFLLNAVRIHHLVLILGIAVGSIGLFLLAAYERYYLGVPRVGSFLNAIQFGNIALSFGLLSLSLSITNLAPGRFNIPLKVMLISSGLMAAFASVLTMTRGGITFLPLIVAAAIWYYKKELLSHYKKVILIVSVLAVCAVLWLPQSTTMSRIQAGVTNTENYFSKGNANTSVGIRLELWKAAILVTMENPLLGAGYTQYVARKSELITAGVIQKSTKRYHSPHNAYVYASARRGVVGFAIFCVFLLYPVYVGHKEANKSSGNKKAVGVSLIVFGLFFIFANLTQVLFAHNSGMIMYTGLLISLVSILNSVKRESAIPIKA